MAKIINIAKKESEWIQRAKKQDRLAQKALYDAYAPKMLSVARYYIHDLHFAEDVMIKGFFKAFTQLDKYEERQHFYAWLRRIVTHECIDFLRSKTHTLSYAEWDGNLDHVSDDLQENTDVEAIQQMVDELPDGCKIIFNLYVIEGLKHKEIAEQLQISVGTSKSQLAYARNCLKEKINQNTQYHV